MSLHGRRQMLKYFCLNLFISFCLGFDLAVNVLCLEIFEIYSVGIVSI